MKKAFLSGLGVMGRRHLLGLLESGFQVVGLDPRQSSAADALQAAATSGFESGAFRWTTEMPAEEFDVAVFCETAPHRFGNLSRFLELSTASRLLLEKPLTADFAELDAYERLLESKQVSPERVCMNLSRRTWPLFIRLKSLCDNSSDLMLTANGGAAGLGSNGIHFLDLYFFLTGDTSFRVTHAALSITPVPSGRGPEFSDFGGNFLVENRRGSFFCSLSPDSSAPPVLVVRGSHFIAWLDEGDLRYRLEARDPDSRKPNYLCGRDYRVVEEGIMSLLPFHKVTANWVAGTLELPGFQEGLRAHKLLFAILETAGRKPPFRFT